MSQLTQLSYSCELIVSNTHEKTVSYLHIHESTVSNSYTQE